MLQQSIMENINLQTVTEKTTSATHKIHTRPEHKTIFKTTKKKEYRQKPSLKVSNALSNEPHKIENVAVH